jgi:hypothetical protein
MLSFAYNYFLIEFTELLRTVSDICLSYYFNYFFIPLLGLIGAIIGGLLSYLGTHQVYKKQLQNERKNIAKAIDIDLNAISDSVYFDIFYKIYKNGGKKIPEKIDQKFIDEKITLSGCLRTILNSTIG